MNQIRAFLIEQGITVRKSVAALRNSLQAILDNRSDEMSLRMRKLILGLQQDWIWTDKRIEMTTSEIKSVSESEASCQRLDDHSRALGRSSQRQWLPLSELARPMIAGATLRPGLGLVPRQHSTGGRTILGRITKRGSRYLRMLFVQAAQVIMMRPKNWHKFSFGPWLEAAATRMQHNKLGVALANKAGPDRLERSQLRQRLRLEEKRNLRLRSDHSRTRCS